MLDFRVYQGLFKRSIAIPEGDVASGVPVMEWVWVPVPVLNPMMAYVPVPLGQTVLVSDEFVYQTLLSVSVAI